METVEPTAEPRSRADQLRARWAGLGGKLGMGFVGLGLLVIAVAWNGAASLDYVSGQIPYLISGGIAGLGLIIVGAALIMVESNRRDRVILEQRLEELAAATNRIAAVQGNGAATAPQAPADGEPEAKPRRRRTRPVQAERSKA
jgi:hypothetical protein